MTFRALTNLELTAVADVLAAQNSFAPNGPMGATGSSGAYELHIAVDLAGVVQIDRQRHPPQGGNITPAMQQAIADPAVGCRIIHNHPSQGSLSASDWRLIAAQSPGLDEMIAVNSRGSQFRGKVVAAEIVSLQAAIPGLAEPAVDIQHTLLNNMMAQFNAANQAGHAMPSPSQIIDHMAWMFSHIVNERFAQLGWVDYQPVLSTADQDDLAHPGIQHLLDVAREEAVKRFP